jgi:hypothetical protein
MSQASIFGTWNSNFGTFTFTGSPQHVTGSWDQGPGKQGKITAGTFNPTTRTLAFSYHQPWNNQDGVAELTLSTDGLQLEGTWSQGNANGRWIMTRSR